MTSELSPDRLQEIVQARDVTQLTTLDLVGLFLEEDALREHAPSGHFQVDPRNGERILFHPLRGSRPVDYQISEAESADHTDQDSCMICQGDTTGVIDTAALSEGFTFINKNLYPMLYPHGKKSLGTARAGQREKAIAAGLHFLQWTSSRHEKDWHNMPLADLRVVFQRLAALEKLLLHPGYSSEIARFFPDPGHGLGPVVSIIKNGGRQVGGSLAHGHQQIAYSNLAPRRILEDKKFEQARGVKFSEYILQENPPHLELRNYGPTVWLIPYFMRRPFSSMLVVKDTSKQDLYQLNQQEVDGVCRGWYDALYAIHRLLPSMGRPPAYNVLAHNGPGAGIYFEFLPFTQERGGFEHLGLSVCQSNPGRAAEILRKHLPD